MIILHFHLQDRNRKVANYLQFIKKIQLQCLPGWYTCDSHSQLEINLDQVFGLRCLDVLTRALFCFPHSTHVRTTLSPIVLFSNKSHCYRSAAGARLHVQSFAKSCVELRTLQDTQTVWLIRAVFSWTKATTTEDLHCASHQGSWDHIQTHC